MTKDHSTLVFKSALDVARAIQRGEITSLEITNRILERIEKYNPAINAVVITLKDDALNQARAADEALAKGEIWGPLHGVPCSIKDTLEIANVITTSGFPLLKNHHPKRDAVVVERMRGAGAIIIGHTNVPLMGGDWQSYNEVYGTTNNPWDLNRTPGGSTGGGAAAIAAGLSYLSIGSDIGGSIRIPSHFCGVYGHKPSLNIVPMRGHIPPLPGVQLPPADLVVVGPLARSAADLKLALQIIGGPDPSDAIAYKWDLPPARGTRLSDYRIGYILDDPLCPVTPEVKKVLLQAIEALRKAGADLEEGWPSRVIPSSQYNTYLFLLQSTYAFELQDDEIEEARAIAAKQDGSYESKSLWAWTAPHKHFQNANIARIVARSVWQDYFKTHDVFLLPTVFIPAFPHDHSQPFLRRQLNTPQGVRPYTDLLFWISFATVTGLPATIAPIGLTDEGLPVGIQIMGPYLEDATPIDIAGKLADIIGEFQPPKGFKT